MKSRLCVWTSMSAVQGHILVILMPSVSMNQGPLLASAKQGTLEMEITVKVSMKNVPVQNYLVLICQFSSFGFIH